MNDKPIKNKAVGNNEGQSKKNYNPQRRTQGKRGNSFYSNVGNRKNFDKPSLVPKPVKIIPLGGLGEIGKNITLYEYDGDMILVDCGMSFPDEEMPGIDIVIPDFTYILENKDKIKANFDF